MSVPPPGGKGTIILIGLDGKALCGEAASAHVSVATTATTLANHDALIFCSSFFVANTS